jgi:hypothetical protein
MENKKITTIKLKNDTKSSLDKFKVIERESYDEVIQRLIRYSSKEQPELNSKIRKDIPEKIKSVREEKTIPERTENVREEKTKFLQNILGGVRDNKKEEALKKGDKKQGKVSSNFSYP